MIVICNVGCSKKHPTTDTAKAIAEFKLPQIPIMLTDSNQINEYLVWHYWDNYDFNDSSIINQNRYTEEIFVNYVSLLPKVKLEKARLSIKNLLQKAQADSSTFSHFIQLTERYFYNPTSVFRNDEYYIPALEVIVASKTLDDPYKIRPNFQLKMALKNRVGSKTTDLNLRLPNGNNFRISDCEVLFTILIFYNPNCHTCHETIKSMKNSELIFNLIEQQKLKIIAINSDCDNEAWLKYQSQIPTTWINGLSADQETNLTQKYDLKASPTLYLLGKDKIILLKDAQIEQIINYLNKAW